MSLQSDSGSKRNIFEGPFPTEREKEAYREYLDEKQVLDQIAAGKNAPEAPPPKNDKPDAPTPPKDEKPAETHGKRGKH